MIDDDSEEDIEREEKVHLQEKKVDKQEKKIHENIKVFFHQLYFFKKKLLLGNV